VAAHDRKTPLPPEPALAGARILIVDDDRTLGQYISRILTENNCVPAVAQTFAEAVRLFREARPDLILLDVMMPHMDGYKTARIFRSEGGAFVPIIMLTALDDLESKRRGMAAGADDFLSKPVTPLELQIRVSSMLRIKRLTDQLDAANRQLGELAVTDPLTGLHNRRHLYRQLEREFARARRYGHPLACLMLDIDHFKQVNDTYGHQVGDRVLVLVGEVLRGSVRTTDFAGRFGGEEFMVLAPETPRDGMALLAERIRQGVPARTGTVGAETPRVTISLGVATTEVATGATADDLVRCADEALYQAKRAGRDRVVVYDQSSSIPSQHPGEGQG
jgi:diguanylate cyclase (GGDEF)-like protein